MVTNNARYMIKKKKLYLLQKIAMHPVISLLGNGRHLDFAIYLQYSSNNDMSVQKVVIFLFLN